LNALGYKGQIVDAYAGLLSDMWTSHLACFPKRFKNMLGRHHEQFRGGQQ
jgi:hypothetical protein